MIEPDILGQVLAAASDIAIVVSGAGLVQAIYVLQDITPIEEPAAWQSRPLADHLEPDSRPKFEECLALAEAGEALPETVELNHRRVDGQSHPVAYRILKVGRDGQLLMLGRDLRTAAESQQQLVQAQVALERGYEERREFDARYRVMLATSRDPILFVSLRDGKIADLNAAALALLGASRDELLGASFAKEFNDRRREGFTESLANLALAEYSADVVAQTRRTRQDVTLTPTLFRAAGERYLIVRLDLEDDPHQLDARLASNLNALFRSAVEAVVFTDPKGVIEEANEAFLELIDAAMLADVKGRNLGGYMVRGQIDMNVMLEHAARSGAMRIYATKLTNDFGAKVPVEISVAYLNNRARPAMAFVIRDAHRAASLRAPVPHVADEATRYNVVELIGSSTLKEIVAETNDVIEKMCIEAAVDMTQNNRAAAAEMLGLSRQSLYVKLRKYDLIEKND